jgi:hypothetical protein
MGEALNEVEALRVPPEVFCDEWWPNFEHELDRVPHLWDEQWTKESLKTAVEMGAVQVWSFGPPAETRVIVFTQLVEYPIGRVLQVFLAFGNGLDAVLPMIEATFEKLAMLSDCVFCEVIGRPGWERKLPRFKRVAVVLRCKIEQKGVH